MVSLSVFSRTYNKMAIDNNFVGLVIDEDNQSELTDKRIEDWVQNIKEDIL